MAKPITKLILTNADTSVNKDRPPINQPDAPNHAPAIPSPIKVESKPKERLKKLLKQVLINNKIIKSI